MGRRLSLIAVVTCAAVGLASGGGNAAAPNALSITFSGGKYTQVPASVPGGITEVQLANLDKAAHGAQLIRYDGDRTPADAYKEVIKQSDKTPAWLHALGGVGPVGGKRKAAAEVDLQPGNYIVADIFAEQGKPAYKAFTVGESAGGALDVVPPTVTATKVGKDKYAWKVAGTLKASTKELTFASKGADALHFLGVFRVKGKPSKQQLIKALKSHGRPPAFIDGSSFYNTAVLDGGVTEVTPIAFTKPGHYVLFCPLTDRDGGKPHFAEGLLKTVTVR